MGNPKAVRVTRSTSYPDDGSWKRDLLLTLLDGDVVLTERIQSFNEKDTDASRVMETHIIMSPGDVLALLPMLAERCGCFVSRQGHAEMPVAADCTERRT